jgi:large subunit ribosomal protein L4
MRRMPTASVGSETVQVPVKSLGSDEEGQIELSEAIFGLEPRPDILHRVVVWQLAKRRAGTHKVRTRGEVRGTTKKMYRQKGTGRARHGARTAPIFRGGGRAFGKEPRDHAIDLPKKVRKLGLKIALSVKLAEGRLIVLDEARSEIAKTKPMAERLAAMGLRGALFIDGPELDPNFVLATRNLPDVDLLPEQGANVYDILRRDVLVLTRDAVRHLEERLA